MFMDIAELLGPGSVIASLKGSGKKQVLQELSRRAAGLLRLNERTIFDTLWERERLGSTGMGNGTAIPHGKIAGVAKPVGLFARLEKPIDFEAVDERPVDLIFVLLTPEGAGADHLKALAQVARILREPGMLAHIRAARDAGALYALLTRSTAPQAA